MAKPAISTTDAKAEDAKADAEEKIARKYQQLLEIIPQLSVPRIWRVLCALPLKIWIGVISTYVTVATSAILINKWIQPVSPSSDSTGSRDLSPAQRVKLTTIPESASIVSGPKVTQPAWLTALNAVLEEEGHAGTAKFRVVFYRTKEFTQPANRASVKLTPSPGQNLTGFAFRVSPSGMYLSLRQKPSKSTDLIFTLPEVDPKDHLLFVLRISTNGTLPDASQLATSINPVVGDE